MTDGAVGDMRVLTSPPWHAPRRNPYNHLLYTHLSTRGAAVDDTTSRRAAIGSYDVWHLHWPEDVLKGHARRAVARTSKLLALLAAARARGTKVVWTIHNLGPHEPGDQRLARVFWAVFPRQVDGAIALTATGAHAAVERFPHLARVPLSVVPHGHYRSWYEPGPPRGDARVRLGLEPDSTTYLFFGQIRPYKNVGALLAAFSRITDPDVQLVVAGEPRSPQIRREMTASAASDPRIHLRLGVVPEPDVPTHLAAADLVVLPFVEGFNSGSAMLALSLSRPVLLPHTPTFRELRDNVGEPWVHLYEGDLTAGILERAAEAIRSLDGAPDLSHFDWDRVAAQTLELYRKVVA